MLHVMHVSDRLLIGGRERMLVDLANQTAADGHPVSVCLLRSGDGLTGSLRKQIPVCRLHRAGELGEPAGSKLSRVVAEMGVSVLHVHGRPALHMLSASGAGRPLPVPLVFHDHFGGIEVDASVPRWFQVRGHRLVSHYVGVCPRLGAWAEQAGIPASRVSVIENALDLNRLARTPGADVRRQFAIPDRVPLGIMVAGLRPSKGLDVLLEAVRRLVPRCSLRILVAGGIRDPGYVDVCRRSIERLRLQEHVRLLGERTDVVSLLQNVDFAVHPARSESGPLVLIEYAVSGVPLAASLTGAVARRLEVRGVPEFVPPGDAAALAAALERLLSLCPAARKQRCAVGRETALREFDIRNVMPRWYELYGRLVERTDAGRPIGEWTC